jgi:hypothetical protein
MNTRARDAGSGTAILHLRALEKVALLARVWWTAGRVWLELRRHALPVAVTRLGGRMAIAPLPVRTVSRAVSRGLKIGPWQPRCIVRSLVLYALLRAQGDEPVIVIGMRDGASSTDAHAWIELEGEDVGPWPGRGSHRELTRYPRPS